MSGNRQEHDRLVNEALSDLAKEVDLIVFAQKSMSKVVHEDPGVPILKIGHSGFEAVKHVIQ